LYENGQKAFIFGGSSSIELAETSIMGIRLSLYRHGSPQPLWKILNPPLHWIQLFVSIGIIHRIVIRTISIFLVFLVIELVIGRLVMEIGLELKSYTENSVGLGTYMKKWSGTEITATICTSRILIEVNAHYGVRGEFSVIAVARLTMWNESNESLTCWSQETTQQHWRPLVLVVDLAASQSRRGEMALSEWRSGHDRSRTLTDGLVIRDRQGPTVVVMRPPGAQKWWALGVVPNFSCNSLENSGYSCQLTEI